MSNVKFDSTGFNTQFETNDKKIKNMSNVIP